MALKAYTSYVKNFTSAMDRVKETCKSVPAFLSFLRVCSYAFHTFSLILYVLIIVALDRLGAKG